MIGYWSTFMVNFLQFLVRLLSDFQIQLLIDCYQKQIFFMYRFTELIYEQFFFRSLKFNFFFTDF